MQTWTGLDGLRSLPRGLALSIGNFDGIHKGHQRILDVARSHGQPLAVVTFEPHPLTVLRPHLAPPRLTPLQLKRRLLEQLGVDHLVILPPQPEVLNLSAEAFWQILRDEVQPACLVEGESFSFGKNRGGSVQKLREWSATTPIQLHGVPPVQVVLIDLSIVQVSSSLIRWLISNGRARDAAICLGRPYTLEGLVGRGFQRGRTIGFPTANLHCGDQMIPADGVYAARCTVDNRLYPAALSIGTMPTFGANRRQIEAHLIGFDGDLYDTILQVELLDWLRDQVKYPSVDALLVQMRKDIDTTLALFQTDPARPIAATVL